MQILPVIDLMRGQVVRGVGGRRDEYRPVVSRLTSSAAPRDVAEAFRLHFGFETLYLADLDAIAGQAPAVGVYRDLWRAGFRLWVDAGLRDVADAAPLLDAGVNSVVAGLETLAGPDALSRLIKRFGPHAVVLSLDLKHGMPLGDAAVWGTFDAIAIGEDAIRLGTRRVLVLDLARVGEGRGAGTEDVCLMLRDNHPYLEITAGGGVRSAVDLRRMAAAGVDYALVASALHDGAIDGELVFSTSSGFR
jgi:phosphoribosylformimino-5-aminoimidazole carboxamide ribotide isomerase